MPDEFFWSYTCMGLWPDMQKQLILSWKLVYLYRQSSASLSTDLIFLLFCGLLLSFITEEVDMDKENEGRKKRGLTLYQFREYPKWGHLLSPAKNSQTLSKYNTTASL